MVPVVLPLSADDAISLCWNNTEPSAADVDASMKVCSLAKVSLLLVTQLWAILTSLQLSTEPESNAPERESEIVSGKKVSCFL